MSDNSPNIHVLDAAYEPFPTFDQFVSGITLDVTRWDRYNTELERAKAANPESIAKAREVVTRAAAIDTGAIEGLYEVDRGFTFTVAIEAATWESTLLAKGEHVRSLFEAQLHAYDYVL